MSTDELNLVERLRVQRHHPLGLPPIPSAPVPLWWIVQGWGGHAIALIVFGALLILGAW